MGHPSEELQQAESTLRSVIEILIDGQEALRQIAEELKDDSIKRHLLAESLKRAEFRGEIETLLHQEGVHDVKESGTTAGKGAPCVGRHQKQTRRRRPHAACDG